MKKLISYCCLSLSLFCLAIAQTIPNTQRDLIKKLQSELDFPGKTIDEIKMPQLSKSLYLSALEKINLALKNTMHPRSLSSVVKIVINETNGVREEFAGSTSTFFLPAHAPAAAYLRLFSKSPELEPFYQNYLQGVRPQVKKALQARLGIWYELFKNKNALFCNRDFSSINLSELENYFSRFNSKVRPEADLLLQGDEKIHAVTDEVLTIKLPGTPNRYVKIIKTKVETEIFSYFLIVDYQGEKLLDIDRQLFLRLDANCDFDRAEVLKYNSKTNALWRRQWLAPSGTVVKTVYSERKILNLDQVYKGINYPRPLNELKKIQERDDRTIVGIIDVGIDYNHPDLAYKLLKSPFRSRHFRADFASVFEELSSLKLEREELIQAHNNKNIFFRLWEKKDFEAELKLISYRIELKEELVNSFSFGRDYRDDDILPYDDGRRGDSRYPPQDHGTHVAGIVAKDTDDLAILPVRLTFERSQSIVKGIKYAYAKGARIVNMSFGGNNRQYWEPVAKAMEGHPDVLFIVAAGNVGKELGREIKMYPAMYEFPNVLTVGATNEFGGLAEFSNFSARYVDILAPGHKILSTTPEGRRDEYTGTSMASPYVARIAGLMKHHDPSLTPQEIIQILGDTAKRCVTFKDKVKFGGIVDGKAAMLRLWNR